MPNNINAKNGQIINMADGVDPQDATTKKQVENADKDTLVTAEKYTDNKVSDLWEDTKAIAYKEAKDAQAAANEYTDKAVKNISVPEYLNFSNKDKGAHVLFEIPNSTPDTRVYLGYHCDAGQFFLEQQGNAARPFLAWFSHTLPNPDGEIFTIIPHKNASPSGYHMVKGGRLYLTPTFTATEGEDPKYSYNRVGTEYCPVIKGTIDISGYVKGDALTPIIRIKLGALSRGRTMEIPYNDDGGIDIDITHWLTRLPYDYEAIDQTNDLSDEIEVK